MNEVKQAWTSLLSSRTPMTSGTTATANSTGNGNHINTNRASANSTATWYDAPIPVIVHGRKFREEIMDISNDRIIQTRIVDYENFNVKESTLNRRVSKDSGIETIASLRRTFLDEVRKSSDESEHDSNDEKLEVKLGETRNENSRSIEVYVVNDESTSRCSSPRRDSPAKNSQLGAISDDVLYQNNVEAALNSLSNICAKDPDSSVDSTFLRNPINIENLRAGENKNDDKSTENTNDSVDVEKRRERSASICSRRHSSSVELTAMTSIKTGDDGMPKISFSFLQSEENSKPFIRDIPLEDNSKEESNLEYSGQLIREQLYDFPKSSRAKTVTDTNEVEESSDKCQEKPKINLPVRRLFGDGSVSTNNVATSVEDRLYDFPKNHNKNSYKETIRIIVNVAPDEKVSRKSTCSANDEEANEERLYKTPTRSKDPSSSTWKESVDDSATENDRDVDKTDSSELESSRDVSKRAYRSLRSERSMGTVEKVEVDRTSSIEAYYSDPECPEGENVSGIDGGRKGGKRQRRLGKAWGRMRSWLREEKLRLGDVVTRHARMQAVGALRSGKSVDSSPLGSRTGSYDLTEARTRELGSITRVEEFGLAAVSEEGNLSDSERPECTSYDLHAGRQSRVENGENDEDDDDDRKKSKLDSSNDSPDSAFAPRKLRIKTVSTDNVLTGTRMKLTPISFSLDKLCTDEGNDEGTNVVVGHRDCEQTRDHVGKGGLIKRRMLGSIRGLMASTHLLQQHETEEVAKLDHKSLSISFSL